MIPEEVCHYTKRETVFKILSTKKLRIGQFKSTNDPRESKERNFPLIWRDNSSPIDNSSYNFNANTISDLSNAIAAEEWKVLCLTLHLPQKEMLNSPNLFLDNHYTKIFNERLRQGYSHPRMWAQYAENHSGVCIIFDGNKLHNIIHNEFGDGYTIFNGPVRYTYKLDPPGLFIDSINEEKIREFYKNNYQFIFLQKHIDWEHEVEYRWLIHSKKNSHEYIPIEGIIKDILVGADFPPHDKPKLIHLCRKIEISVGEMTWHDGLPIPRLGNLYKP